MEKIYIKTKVFAGEDALERLDHFEQKKIWLICDEFLVRNGAVKEVTKHLEARNKVVLCGDVVPDPPLEIIAKGVAMVKSIQPDIMIAFGGGSAIDTAKGVIYFARIANLMDQVKFIAIPTTSGTGSEVTSATVITDREQKVKHLIADDDLIPDEVILCPTLTVSVPPQITANTGMDVLTHAIEAYVAKDANAYSDALAEKACELVFDHLYTCYTNGENLEARCRMQEASNLAGSAFNLAGLGMNHAIAHQLGGMYHIPHGLANALLLKQVILRNAQECKTQERYAKLAVKLNLAEQTDCEQKAVEQLAAKIESCMTAMHMPKTLRECGVTQQSLFDNIQDLSKNSLNDHCALSAPCTYCQKEIENILLSIY